MYLYSVGVACDMVCYLLADGVLSALFYIWMYPKFKQFSLVNLGYMQKTTKAEFFAWIYVKRLRKSKSKITLALVQYVYTIQKIEIEI